MYTEICAELEAAIAVTRSALYIQFDFIFVSLLKKLSLFLCMKRPSRYEKGRTVRESGHKAFRVGHLEAGGRRGRRVDPVKSNTNPWPPLGEDRFRPFSCKPDSTACSSGQSGHNCTVLKIFRSRWLPVLNPWMIRRR
jgi:hypothetical protein